MFWACITGWVVVPLNEEGSPREGLVWKLKCPVFTMLSWSCVLDIEGERSERLLGPQWKGWD